MSVRVDAGLGLPHADEGKLSKLVAGKVRRHARVQAPDGGVDFAELFDDAFFSLDRVKAFRDADHEKQGAVRAACGQAALEEAYFIEKSGIAYCARMVLLAEDTPTRQAFALMGADEAAHLAFIVPYVPEARRANATHPFLTLIASLIEEGPPRVLVYVLQAILEGWGLAHYRNLASAARSPALESVFRAILKDEGMHVQLGAALIDPRGFTDAERALTLDVMAQFLSLVRCGPIGVTGALAQALDGAPRAFFEALNGEAEAARKLALLKSLMAMEGMGWAGAALEEHGLFAPMRADDAVALLRD